MGLLNNLFKTTFEGEKSSNINWLNLTEGSQLAEIMSQSNLKPVLIFKHSTRCGISRMALKSFEREYDLDETAIDLYFLDLLNYRALSTEISEKFNIHHQSPQVLVVKNGQVIYHNSHYQISVDVIKKVI